VSQKNEAVIIVSRKRARYFTHLDSSMFNVWSNVQWQRYYEFVGERIVKIGSNMAELGARVECQLFKLTIAIGSVFGTLYFVRLLCR